MDLYTFGFNGHSQLNLSKDRNSRVQSPVKVATGTEISIAVASWCDAVTYLNVNGRGEARYLGTAFDSQRTSDTNLYDPGDGPLFGEPLGLGLQGKISGPGKVIFFPSPTNDSGKDTTSSSTYDTDSLGYSFQLVAIASSGRTAVLMRSEAQQNSAHIAEFRSLSHWEKWLGYTTGVDTECALDEQNIPGPVASHPVDGGSISQVIAGATTFTALNSEGVVLTWTPDPRYPKCLGRAITPEAPNDVPCPVPFLSETKIKKIASGGYLTAALSVDGELFIWGQACPGMDGELTVLRLGHDRETMMEQDEFVKCVEVEINGREAQVYDVAVGSGHILVAAQVEIEGNSKRAVFAMGQGESGQLGLGEMRHFESELKEVTHLRGMKVASMSCAGWSTWIVVETNSGSASG